MSLVVLLVEDDADTRELLGRALRRAGHECIEAADGAEALSRARAARHLDVVVSDLVLGNDDRGGLRLIESLRQEGISANTICVTAFADVDRVKTALNQGVRYFMEKPFRANELLDAVARLGPSSQQGGRAMDAIFERAGLTDKERSVAKYLLEGLSSTEIAAREHNSPKTIRQHVSEVYSKCQVSSRAQFFRLIYLGRGPKAE